MPGRGGLPGPGPGVLAGPGPVLAEGGLVQVGWAEVGEDLARPAAVVGRAGMGRAQAVGPRAALVPVAATVVRQPGHERVALVSRAPWC